MPHSHDKTPIFIAALRQTHLSAPLVLDGPMKGEVFYAYMAQVLVPTLRKKDIVIMDNLPAYKMSKVKEWFQQVGAQLRYLLT